MLLLAPLPAKALPSCELLRRCAAALADEMAGGPGDGCGQIWPPRVIQQYRRISATLFEARGAGHACGPTFQIIAQNALMMFEKGQLCRLPPACKPENLGDLPDLPTAE